MPMTFSGRRFNQDASAAKRAAEAGPVFITDRGRPAHVLLTMAAYRRLVGEHGPSAADLLADAQAAEVAFEPPRLEGTVRPAAFD